jgi:curved DNA-binding protein
MSQTAVHEDLFTLEHAYRLLGLAGPADEATVKIAFRKAVKAARPDVVGGDPDLFRRVIAAMRIIQANVPAYPAIAAPGPQGPAPSPQPVISLTPLQAVGGSAITLRLGTRFIRVKVPAGLRTGDHIRLRKAAADGSDLHLPVLIRVSDGLTVIGDDMYMSWPVGRRTVSEGGRLEIETHAGPRSAWITPGLDAPIRIRLSNLGLPARAKRPAGHLFVTLEAVEDAPSAAEHLLARFTRVWTPERLAA